MIQPTGAVGLGRLVRRDAREVWAHEAHEFTPWLLEHIDQLNEAIGFEIEISAREERVGPFAVDLYGKEVQTGHPAIIENQLEPSDHSHLQRFAGECGGREWGLADCGRGGGGGDEGIFARSAGADRGGGGGGRGAPGGRAAFRGRRGDGRELPAAAARDGGARPAPAPRRRARHPPGTLPGAARAAGRGPRRDAGAALRDLGGRAGAERQRQHEGADDRARRLDA